MLVPERCAFASTLRLSIQPTRSFALVRRRLGSADGLDPNYPGMDAAGVIDELGPETDSRLKGGDRVIAFVIPAGSHGGAYAEYVVVPASS